MEGKPKLEPGLHLSHSLHSMNSMAASIGQMGMPAAMRLHPHLHAAPPHSLAAVSAAAAAHQLHQPASVSSVGSLPPL